MDIVSAILVGLGSGIFSGLFGVGGAVISTPAVRLILGAPATFAVGTTLPPIFPTTVAGAIVYAREHLVLWRVALWAAAAGLVFAFTGGWASHLFGDGRILMIITAALVLHSGIQMWRQSRRQERAGGPAAPGAVMTRAAEVGADVTDAGERDVDEEATSRPTALQASVAGGLAGFVSGLLGVGGGIVLLPLLCGRLKVPLKRTLGTSLAVISCLVPFGTLGQWKAGHIDWSLALWLTLGTVPGAVIGARFAVKARERFLRRLVAGFLIVVALFYAGREIIGALGGT